MSKPNEAQFAAIDPSKLDNVQGGVSSSSSQLQATLTSITSSINDLASQKNQGMDPTMMLMMVMMMSGGGGGGGVIAAPGVAAGPPVINVDTGVSGGGGWGWGRRGWCGPGGGGGGCGGKGGKKGW